MATNNYPKRKKRYKIKYKNLAILLAGLLLIILLISKGCSAIFNRDGKNDGNGDTPLTTGDTLPDEPALPDSTEPPPTSQLAYLFDFITLTEDDLGTGNLVLVNNNIEFRGSVSEDELDVVYEKKNSAYKVKDLSVMVRPVAMEALNNMLLDFNTVTGNDGVEIMAGYRTYEYQQELYDEELESTGETSSTLVARPGYSEHHTGLAVDFTTNINGTHKSYDGTGDYAWINENCYKYGFINRYPAGKEQLTLIDNEPWHFRYVGVPHATVMHNYDYCLEEYINFIKNYTISNSSLSPEKPDFLQVETDDGSIYMIYYVPMTGETTNIYIPLKDKDPNSTSNEMYPYEISGNNIDGWIVTFLYQQGTGSISPQPAGSPENVLPENSEPDSGDADNTENQE